MEFQGNLSRAPALSGWNLPGKKIEQFGDTPRRSATVETLDDQRVRRGAWQTAFPEPVTFTHRVDDALLIIRTNYPGASSPPQQSRHGAFVGQREDGASCVQVLESFARDLYELFFGKQQQQVGLQQAAQGLGVAEPPSHFYAPLDSRF